MLYLNAILALAAPAPMADQPVIDFSLHSSSVAPHATLPYEVTTETYYSNAIKLKAGRNRPRLGPVMRIRPLCIVHLL